MTSKPSNTLLLVLCGAVAVAFAVLLFFVSRADTPTPQRSGDAAALSVDAGPSASQSAVAAVPEKVAAPSPVASGAVPLIDPQPVAPSPPRAGEADAELSADPLREPWDAVAAPTSEQVPTPKPEVVAARDVPAPRSEAPRAVAPRVRIVDSALARGVENRSPVDAATAFGTDAGTVWAWVSVENTGPPTQITMVWRKGDEVAWRLTLDVGTSSGWRTWSRKTVRDWDAGEWFVDIYDEAGLRVDKLRFEIAAPGAAPLASAAPGAEAG